MYKLIANSFATLVQSLAFSEQRLPIVTDYVMVL